MSAGRFHLSIFLLFIALFGMTGKLRAAPTHSFTLDNGLEVYFKPVDSDSKTLDLRLILDFGAADEQVGQRGWAHLIEHLAFSGTERFSAEQIRALYQGENFRLGRDINAATGDHHTVYQLSVPRGDLKLLEQNLELMVDWLSDMSFSAEALKREKRVIAAEALETQGRIDAPAHWQDVLLSSEQGAHAAIGVMADLQQATPDALQAFWLNGYRPDRAKLLLSGDFIPAQAAARVHATLARLGSVGKRQSTSTEAASTLQLPGVVVTTTSDTAQSQVLVARMAEGAEQIQQASLAMLALHLKLEMTQTPATCGSFQRRIVTLGAERELHYVQQGANVGHELKCLGAITEATQALHQGELSSAFLMQLFHRAQSERQRHQVLESNSKVRSIADVLAARLLKGATAVTTAERWASVTDWLDKRDTALVAQGVSTILSPDNLSLVVQAAGADVPSESAVANLWHVRSSKPRHAVNRADYTLINPLAQSPIDIIEPSSGQRTLHYANGAQVHLLQTDNISDHFDVLLVREGGLLSLPSPLVAAAARLPVVLPQRGFALNTAADVHAGIKKHKLGFSWFVENFRQGLRASARGADAGALFSMLHQSQQVLPAHEYQAMQVSEASGRHSGGEEGQRQLRRVIWRTLYDLGEPARPETPVVLNADNFQSARDRLFSGATGLHLYIAGDFDWQIMQALSDQYIGSLSASATEHQVPGLFASDKRRRIVHRGNQPTRADMLFYYVQSASNKLERYDAELLLMREVLAQRLWHVLREREGLGYDVSLQLQRRAYQRGGSSLKVSMVCDPSFAGAVRKGVDEVLLSLLVQGVDELELAPMRGRLSADYNTLLKDNAALLDEWANQRERGRSLVQVLRTVSEIEQVDAARLQQFARLFFKETGFLEVNVVPGLQADRGGEQAAFATAER